MATPIPIDDAEDPRLAGYRDIRERDLVGRQGRFVAEGEVVLRLLLSRGRFPVESVLLSRRRLENAPDLATLVPEEAPLYVADDGVIERTAGFQLHRGVLAIGRRIEADMQELLSGLAEQALVLVAVGIANHDNMGGIFRNAAAFGVGAVLLDPTCCDPLYRKAIRVSVGAALVTPFAKAESTEAMLAALASNNFRVLALSPAGRSTFAELPVAPRNALLLGAEGPGLPLVLMARLETVRIPMAADFDSLNVAVTAGIALAALFRPKG
ncbi:MAG: TrmH family RNA methyltransferase [Beijerinckiaceae bacterium]